MTRFVIVDGHSQIYRAIHSPASSAIRNRRGKVVGGIVAFFKIFDSLIDVLKPDYFVVTLDGPREELERRKMFPAYKMNRTSLPKEISWQVGEIVRIIKSLKVATLQIKGHEADDAIASLVDICASPDIEIVIVTRDKDLQQTLQPNVIIYEPIAADWIDHQIAAANWGVSVDQITEVQCLMGDTADNIPGVPGIGKVKATKLIQEYGTARRVWGYRKEHTPAVRKALDGFDLSLGYKLVEMRRDLRIDLDSEQLEWNGYDRHSLRHAFRALGLIRH